MLASILLLAGTAAELLGGSVAGWWAWSCQVYYLADVVIPAGVSRTYTNLGCGYAGLGGIAGFTVVYTAVADKRIRNI